MVLYVVQRSNTLHSYFRTDTINFLKLFCMLRNEQTPFVRVFIRTQSKIFTMPTVGSGVLWWACLCVCVFVCLLVCEHISRTTCPIFTNFLYIYSRGSVLLWLRCDMLCTSGFLLWMPSFVHIMAKTMRRKNEYTQIGSTEGNMDLTAWHILKVTHHGQHRTGSENLIFLRLPCFHTLEITAWTKLSRAALHFCT